MSTISFQELDLLSGEMLPERTLLSTVTDFSGGGDSSSAGSSSSSSSAAAAGGGSSNVVADDDGAVVVSACQSTYSPGTPGLTGTLGLGSSNPGSSQTCTPAAVATY